MAKSKVLLSTEEPMSREKLAELLHDLADKMAEGEVILRQGNDGINLEIPTNLVLEVKVEEKETKQKGTKSTLELEIEWYDQAEGGGPLELA